jgi:hypothetical protein
LYTFKKFLRTTRYLAAEMLPAGDGWLVGWLAVVVVG